jgi:hypothetical protein
MAKQMIIPKYTPGSVIDLGHKYGERMPNRIKIVTAYIRNVDKGWMYEVFSEMHNCAIFMSEKMIDKRISKHTSQCYNLQVIKDRYYNGYRFCGNYPDFIAKDKAQKMKDMEGISGVILSSAVDSNGNNMREYHGLWVKYRRPISDNGNIQFDDECIVIK